MQGKEHWHELCATFSVKDHMYPGAFIAEVLLYDHLIIPVVPTQADGLSRAEAEYEWNRWKEVSKWDPARQTALVGVLNDKLKDRILQVPWTKELQEEWKAAVGQTKTDIPESTNVGVSVDMVKARKDGYFESGRLLEKFAPAMAKTVVAVSPYRSLKELKEQKSVKRVRQIEKVPASALMAVFGFELFVPHDPDRDDHYLLAEAAEVASDPKYRAKRTALYLWLQRFVDSTGETTDAESIRTAVKEMQHLVEELKNTTGWRRYKNISIFFKAGYDIAKLAHPLGAAAANAAVSVGDFAAKNALESSPLDEFGAPAAALVLDIHKRLKLTTSGQRRNG